MFLVALLSLHLTITAPPEAQGAADDLFAHFVA